jgi:hypothetical protein
MKSDDDRAAEMRRQMNDRAWLDSKLALADDSAISAGRPMPLEFVNVRVNGIGVRLPVLPLRPMQIGAAAQIDMGGRRLILNLGWGSERLIGWDEAVTPCEGDDFTASPMGYGF